MRVLHVAPSFARRDGGPSEVLRGLIPALRSLGATVELIATDKGVNESDADLLSDPGTTVFRSHQPDSWTFCPAMAGPMQDAVRRADIVHIHSIQTFTSTITMRAARKANVPYVIQPHGALDSYHWKQRKLKKSFYMASIDRFGVNGLDGVLYSSPRETADGAAVLRKVPAFSMPLGVDPSLLTLARTIPAYGPQEVLFLGRVTAKKRLDVLLEAFAEPRLRDLDARLTVAGPIDARLAYDPLELAAQLGVADRVDFLGQVDAAMRRRLLARAAIFVLPSEDESFGVAVAEALAAGCPVIATSQVGIASTAEAEGGLRICALDPTDIAAVLGELLESPSEAATLGQRGQAHARGRYTWEHAAKAALSCYERVTSTRSQTSRRMWAQEGF